MWVCGGRLGARIVERRGCLQKAPHLRATGSPPKPKGGREEHSRSGICSLLFPCGPEKGHGWYFFLASVCISFLLPPLPPNSVFLALAGFVFLFFQCLWCLSTSVPSALSLCLPGIPLSSPKPEIPPFSPAPAPRARVCPRGVKLVRVFSRLRA